MSISMLDNISYRGQEPDNERSQFNTVADMVAYSENYLPEIYETLVVENGKKYQYKRSNDVDPELGRWRPAGEGGDVDLSAYAKKKEVEDALKGYVEAEEGKGLSTNDYTDEEAQKVTDATEAIALLNDADDKAGSVAYAAAEALKAAKNYTDEVAEKLNQKKAIACDEKPTLEGGTITYKEDGETKTTTNTDQWFYYTIDETLYQTTYIAGKEKTIISGGGVDFSKFVNKESDIVSTFTGSEVETGKVPDIAALKALKVLEDEEIGKRVPTAQGAANAGKVLMTDEEGNVKTEALANMGLKAEHSSYENDAHPEWGTLKKAIDGLIAKVEYVAPEIKSFTVTPATTVYEVGQSVSGLEFAWAFNKDVTSQSLTDVSVELEDRSGTYAGPLTTSKTFTLTCSDGENTAKKDISIAFRNKIYYGGAAEPAEYNSAFILGLAGKQFATAKKGSYAVTVGAGEYGYIAYPSSFGKLTSVYIGGFETTVEDCGTVSFTNASGGVASYSIYRTGRQGLGSITMEVK